MTSTTTARPFRVLTFSARPQPRQTPADTWTDQAADQIRTLAEVNPRAAEWLADFVARFAACQFEDLGRHS